MKKIGELESASSELKIKVSRLEKEKDDSIADKEEAVAYGVDVARSVTKCNKIAQIRAMNPDLEFSTEGMDVRLIVEDGRLVEPQVLKRISSSSTW